MSKKIRSLEDMEHGFNAIPDMEIFDGKIIIPSSKFNNGEKIEEYDIKAFVSGFGNYYGNNLGMLVPHGHFLNLIIEKKSEALTRKLAVYGRLFDLKLEGIRYLGCIISEEKTVDYLQIEDLVFEREIKIGYLRVLFKMSEEKKKEKCKGCPELSSCNDQPINCLRYWSALFTGHF